MAAITRLSALLLLLLSISAAAGDGHDNRIAVDVGLWVMSKCPDAVFCENALAPVLRELKAVTTVTLHFIGQKQKNGTYTCKHGPAECAGDLQQLCVQAHSKAYVDWPFRFALCSTRHGVEAVGEFANVAACLKAAGIPLAAATKMLACMYGPGHDELLQAELAATAAAGVGTSCTIQVDGNTICVRDGGEWKDCPAGTKTDDFKQVLCAALAAKSRGRLPPVCRAPTAATAVVTVTTLSSHAGSTMARATCLALALLAACAACASAARMQRDQLRILSLGDSITEGSVPSKNLNHPYTLELEKQLRRRLPSTRVFIDNEGVGGAGIFAVGFHNPTTIIPVAERAIQASRRRSRPYDYVIVMLGINDLLREGRSAEDVKGGLVKIYELALDSGARVLAIPPFAAPGFVSKDDYKESERKKLAGLIAAVAAEQNARRPGGPSITVLDLQAGPMDFYAMDDATRGQWLDDGLHMTETGYDSLGRHIARAIARDAGASEATRRRAA
ncbi:hypothetical protein HT031_005237 [Scenedesmus sp. PABB004]|nr:hypothetical protein HT031_005237 [Scenedesmus sp. PABB004]